MSRNTLEDIYDYSPSILSQFCYANRVNEDFAQWEAGEHIEDVDGMTAKLNIMDAIMAGAEPVYVSGWIMGYIEPEGKAYLYTDCDELTYKEYYGESYSG